MTAAEIRRMAAFLGMSEEAFIEEHTRLREDRRGLALKERPNHECIFLEGRDCQVQPVKPQQCRDFPNLWRFEGFERYCRAVPREVDEETYVRLVREATGRRSWPGMPKVGGGASRSGRVVRLPSDE